VFTREQIIAEIRRLAAEQGRPPGVRALEHASGIKQWDWEGRYWARWNDALVEAGFAPNELQGRLSDDDLIAALVAAIRDLGHFPTRAEMMLRRREDPRVPNPAVVNRRGGKAAVAALVLTFCRHDPAAYADVIAVVEPLSVAKGESGERITRDQAIGHVYLLKLGRHYKIGRSNAFGRREYELGIQMPEKATTVHVINTDDPVGIEAYWHRRFVEKRVRPDAEWFALSADDVRAFRRRAFQ